jgi:hypothetical protein
MLADQEFQEEANQDGHIKKNASRLFIVKSMCQEQ